MDELAEYAKEVGAELITLESLIKSHRRLRQQAMATYAEMRLETQQAAERAAAMARESVLHGEYISVEKLMTMSIGEIVEFSLSLSSSAQSSWST